MHIALVEDEKLLSSRISKKLKGEGHTVNIFNDLKSFTDFGNYKFDLYIIDVILTDGLGFSLLENIRKVRKENSAIIMISGLDLLQNKLFSLDSGADDFLTKPFSPDELVSRINAISRRINKASLLKYENNDLLYKNIVYSYKTSKITQNGYELLFTPKEKQIIEYFLRNVGKFIKRNDLINDIWGEYNDTFISDNTINVTLCRVRNKLGDDFELDTLRGEGFILKN